MSRYRLGGPRCEAIVPYSEVRVTTVARAALAEPSGTDGPYGEGAQHGD